MAYIKPDSKKDYALILGASSGFGEGAALELASEGFNIIGVHMDRGAGLTKVEQIKRQIEDFQVEALYFNLNAASDKNREQVIQRLTDHFKIKNNGGKIKVMMHSLAFGSLAPYVHNDPAQRLSQKQMDMTLNVMAHSLVYWTRDLLLADFLTKGTKIYAMTSSGSTRVTPYYGAVSAAKAALESHIRQLALELAPYGITANSLRAGVTFTPALRKIPGHETMIDLALSQIPSKRLTQPSDVAKYISSQATSDEIWNTGNVINLDGGEFVVAFHTPLKK
ncbi:MAG: SDR family oxidoreductase [Calditrichales bacterium]|nr:MAG: SDR family oxidoreductase [Calditrichales bacterium]